jgi:polyhydroxyalkanoate synthesis regulator phasin
MELFESLRKAMFAGFGAQDKVREFIDELVKKGELSESQGAKLVKEWTEKAEKNEHPYKGRHREAGKRDQGADQPSEEG